MAKALIIDDAYGKIARTYYLKFPEEPVSSGLTVSVDDPELVKEMSLDRLLQAIITWKKGSTSKDLVLVSHGNERGLTMRLFPGHRTDSRSDVLETLMGSDSRESKAKMLSLTPQQVDSLVAKISEVQQLGISTVEFRGCNIGRVKKNLDVLKSLLGAGSVGAPDELSTFGLVKPRFSRTTKEFDKWNDAYSAKGHAFAHINRIIFYITPIPKSHMDKIDLYVEDKSIIPEWLGAFMSNAAPKSFQNWMATLLPVHYLTVIPPILPLDGSNSFTVPASQSYVGHIIRTS